MRRRVQKILITIKKCHGHKPARELTQLTKKCQQDEDSPLYQTQNQTQKHNPSGVQMQKKRSLLTSNI